MGFVVRALDWLFFVFFLVHIPITILIDTQAVFKDFHPKFLVDFTKAWAVDNGDPFMAADVAPTWFQTTIYAELFFQVPFFLLAVPAFFSQSAGYNWMRTPCVMYSAQAITAILPILAELALVDYSEREFGPKTSEQRLGVLAVYVPFLIVPILLLWRTLSGKSMWQKKVKCT